METLHPSPQLARMGHSDQIHAIALALSKAQAAFAPILKNRTVSAGQYSFDYAPLDTVLEAVQPALTGNALAVFHMTDGIHMKSVLAHESGQYIFSSFPLTADGKNRMQALGSALTYGQRYNVRLLLNLASETDDDGNAAAGNDAQVRERPMTGGGSMKQYRNDPDVIEAAERAKAAAAYKGEPADNVPPKVKSWVNTSIEGLGMLDGAGMAEFWTDADTAAKRATLEQHYPTELQRLTKAMAERRLALLAVKS